MGHPPTLTTHCVVSTERLQLLLGPGQLPLQVPPGDRYSVSLLAVNACDPHIAALPNKF